MENYYLAHITYEEEIEDRKGNPRIKQVREKYLVRENNIPNAYAKVKEQLTPMYNSFIVTKVEESNIVGVLE